MTQPRFGRTMTASLLRPFAEQLMAVLRVPPSATVCELLSDSGELSRSLAGAIGPGGTLILTETDPELLEAGASRAGGLCAVQSTVINGGILDLDDGTCDRVASLLTLGGRDAESLLSEARRVLRDGGIAALVVWDGGVPPAHVSAMSRALRDEVGYASPFLQRLSGPICAPGFSVTELHDVARFDGVRHLWVAFIEEGRLGGELGHLSAEQHAAVRRRFEDSLAEYAAADGTLRLPVAARLLRLSSDSRS